MSTKNVLSWSLVLVSVMCMLVFLLCVIPYQVLGGLTPCGWLDGILIHTECVKVIHSGTTPIKIVFTPDGQYIYGTSSDILSKYYLSDGSLAQSMNKSRVDDIALSRDGNKLAVRGNGWGQLWQADNGTPLANFPIGQKEDIDAMAFAPDNQTLAIATQIIGPGFSYRIYFWHIADGSVQMLEGEGCDFGDLNYSPDGTLLAARVAAGERNCGIFIWRVSDQKFLYNLPISGGEIAFSPDSKLLAVGGDYGDISLFQVENGSLVRTMNENSLQVNSVAFSADGQLLTSGDICSARLWNPTTGKLLKVFNHGCANSVQSVRFSPDGQFLVTATRMGAVRFFKLPLDNK